MVLITQEFTRLLGLNETPEYEEKKDRFNTECYISSMLYLLQQEKKEELKAELEYEESKAKRRSLGNIR